MKNIRPWLYVGGYRDTKDASLLGAHKIGAILELAELVEHPGINTLYLAVDDAVPLDLKLLEQGVAFVRQAKAQEKRVLVACGAGISRSVTFAIATLKEEEGLNLVDTFAELLNHHAEAMPHPTLWESLCKRYQEPMSFVDMWEYVHDLRRSDSL